MSGTTIHNSINLGRGHRFRGKVAIAEQRDLFRCRLNDAVYDEIALYGFGHHHRSASQIPVAQGPQRDDAAAPEEGQHTLSLDADSYVLAFEQQVPRLGEGDPVRYGFFHDRSYSGALFSFEDRGVGEFGRCLVRQAGQVPHRGLGENVRQRTADSVLQIAVVGECRGGRTGAAIRRPARLTVG